MGLPPWLIELIYLVLFFRKNAALITHFFWIFIIFFFLTGKLGPCIKNYIKRISAPSLRRSAGGWPGDGVDAGLREPLRIPPVRETYTFFEQTSTVSLTIASLFLLLRRRRGGDRTVTSQTVSCWPFSLKDLISNQSTKVPRTNGLANHRTVSYTHLTLPTTRRV